MNQTIHILLSVLLIAALSTVNVVSAGDCNPPIDQCTDCTATNVCDACKEGYFLDTDSTCKACSTDGSCKTCNVANTCATCNDGFYKDGDTCKACSTDGSCKTCSAANTCTTCNDGFFLNTTDNTCKACSTDGSCKTCTAANTCTTCNDHFGVVSDKCSSCTDANCKNCDGNVTGCQTCADGYKKDATSGKCAIACTAADCTTCVFNTSDQCNNCSGTKVVKNGKCEDNADCPVNYCAKCDTSKKCTQCEDKYQKNDDGTCKLPCTAPSCTECQPGRSDVCKTCDPNHQEKDGKCVDKDGVVNYFHVTPAAFAVLLASAVALQGL